jgi:hypothetical protein
MVNLRRLVMFRMREETVVTAARTEVRLELQGRDTRTLSAPESIKYSQENADPVLYPLDLLLMVAFTKKLRGGTAYPICSPHRFPCI